MSHLNLIEYHVLDKEAYAKLYFEDFFIHHTFKNYSIVASTLNMYYIIIMGNFDFFYSVLQVTKK